jgi:hypothetical protein
MKSYHSRKNNVKSYVMRTFPNLLVSNNPQLQHGDHANYEVGATLPPLKRVRPEMMYRLDYEKYVTFAAVIFCGM